ncbi:MAG TPA: response regulator transcription factor [Flavipsychrobacter sp.]|jgi:DNA-binding NarL/FixJ family response regulator|nr:response regulator transcription factor [Flavipsychrobacter sp.]
MDQLVKIALAEDNGVNRNTFLNKTREITNCELVFIANNGNECLEKLKASQHLPEVIFMDLEMPQMNGIQTISLAKAIYPQIHFIVLTVFDDDEKIFEAIKAGASGYLLKHEPAATLEEAIKNVIEFGGAPMSPAIARKALHLLSRTAAPDQSPTSSLPSDITEREKEILQYVVNGWDSKKIAATINLSVLTVRKHIANIYTKLHINSKAQAINMAHKEGWFNN